MTFLEKLEVIERVDGLIRRKATGSADELAQKIGVSRSTIFEIINCMKTMGAEIEYSNIKRSYHYIVEKDLAIGFVTPNKINGGKSQNIFHQSDFFFFFNHIFSAFS
ncbi:MAG: HTH domain-containing protein [Bacteroidetes bacterium]|nr:HTH domain-containing protein [Bacteroidota bacterium]